MPKRAWVVAVAVVVLGAPAGAAGQLAAAGGGLTLEEALRLAEERSEEVAIARAGLLRARGERLRARSAQLPQLSAFLNYDRALASEFEGAFGGGRDSTAGPSGPPCVPYAPDPTLPLERRLGLLEAAFTCDDEEGGFGGIDFGELPFGRENTYRLGLSFSQSVFTGGRAEAQNRIADAGAQAAEVAFATARAQLVLDVTQAYYDAALSDRLVAIAEATLAQAEETLALTRLAREVGNQPEFELLRAQVTVSNQRPQLILQRAARDQAYLRLQQLLELPGEEELRLAADLDDPTLGAAAAAATEAEAAQAVSLRAPVRQAESGVRVGEAGVRIAGSQRLPSLSVSSAYSRVAYPSNPFPSALDQFRTNWTVSASVQLPILTGGRIRGDILAAQADLDEARARLQQARELALVDTRGAYDQLAAARAAWEAGQGTVEQASRAFQIAELRYREGISTQLELNDARIQLQQAQANRAQAARDLQVARTRVGLLRDLPLGAGAVTGGTGGAGRGGVPPAGRAPAQAPRQVAPQQRIGTQTPNGGFTGFGG